MRGAPRYHIVLWIRYSPVLGRDSFEKVLSFIQERITCHIADSAICKIRNAQVQCILQEELKNWQKCV